MSAPVDPNSHENESVRFEPTDVATRPVALSVVSLAVFAVVFTFIGHLVYNGLAARERANSPAASPLAEQYAAKEPPAPRLQVHPKTDLEALHAEEDKALSTLAWVDKNAGVVQVPIERAMEMLLAKGLPARQAPVPAKMAPHGIAPDQYPEASGAPDWNHAPAGHGEHAAHEAASDAAHGAASEAHGH